MVNDNIGVTLPREWPNKVVSLDGLPVDGLTTLFADVVNREYRLRHDPEKLATALMGLVGHRSGRGRSVLEKEPV